MRRDRTEPCPQCPFRTNAAPGWLGSYSAEEIVQHIRAEMPFPCHPTVDYEAPNWRKTLYSPGTTVQACAGYLILMRRMCKLPRDPEALAQIKRLDMEAKVFRTPIEFVNHHQQMK